MIALIGTPFGIFPGRVDRRALRRGRGEARVGVRGLWRRFLSRSAASTALPCQSRHSAGGSSVMPSHHTPPSGVSATLVKIVFFAKRRHRVRIGLDRRARRHAEEAGLGIDRAQPAVRVGLDPGDVVAHRPDLPAPFEAGGRNQHRKIGLAAGARKRRGHVGLLALRILDAEDQHVLGHPAFVARDVRGDAQREALLAQQRVAAVARAVRPDLARLRKVHDVFLFVARPGHVLLAPARAARRRCACTARRACVLVDLLEHRQADARHDPHVDHDVRRVGQLHADLRHRRADRTHAERQHVHRAAAHAAVEKLLQLLAHLKRIDPVVGGAGACPSTSEQMKVRSSTRATSLASERA